jgi:hypothetical protein
MFAEHGRASNCVCKETNCPSEALYMAAGMAQRMQCGYSAIEMPTTATAIPPTPQPDYLCAENMMRGGTPFAMAMRICTR